jgi:predicted metal-dependent hydrolase
VPAGDLHYTVRRSARARRVRVRVEHDGAVTVTLPDRAREREAAAAVRELRPWIDRRLAAVQVARAAIERPAGTLPWLGGTLMLREEPGRTRAHRRGDVLHAPAGAQGRTAIERWYRRAARAEVLPRVAQASAALGVAHGPVTIRDQRTRWGSCSQQGALAFNWRLLLGPEEVLDYVVWHEACHLVVFDHSRGFWELLARHRPGYRAPRRWLRDNGAALHL